MVVLKKTSIPKPNLFRVPVTDHELVDRIFSWSCIWLCIIIGHLAAKGLSHFIRRFNYTNNLIGSVIHQCFRCIRWSVLFYFSIAVYGGLKPIPTPLTLMPEDPYGVAKYAVELDPEICARNLGLNGDIPSAQCVVNIEFRRQIPNVVGFCMNQLMGEKNFQCSVMASKHGIQLYWRQFSHCELQMFPPRWTRFSNWCRSGIYDQMNWR